jgi:hypothetical protein
LSEGIPNEPRFPERRDEYITSTEKENNAITQWLEAFKSKFAEYEESADIIGQVDTALSLFQSVVGKGKAKVEIQRAIEAKRAQGSVLEYGIKWHLERFNNRVRKN